ncbi:hypothetical protein [Microbispora sp. NPDC049125]|uniref:hypothetical protein n=1 Tax=Microbispora sp. NPDC049125 TaxID=3154929 RepID=UPI003466A381
MLWHHSFGVTGILDRCFDTPWWTGLIIGVAGLVLAVTGHRLGHPRGPRSDAS